MLTACTWWVVECRAGGAKIERGPEPAVTPSGSRTAGLLGLLGNVLCLLRDGGDTAGPYRTKHFTRP